jgi:hypothetical protein
VRVLLSVAEHHDALAAGKRERAREGRKEGSVGREDGEGRRG